MKRIVWYLLTTLAVAVCVGCIMKCAVFHTQKGIIGNFLPRDDKTVSADWFAQVTSACQAQDAGALTALFAPNAIAEAGDFEGQVQALLAFWDGKLISWDQWAGPQTDAHFNDPDTGGSRELLHGTFDVETEGGTLRFALEVCTMDTTDPDNLGIHSLYAIRGEDSDMDFAYWGGWEWKSGITIASP